MTDERTLDQVRHDIDAVDDALHDLLMRRTQLVEEVRRIKAGWSVKIQPSREAEIIYRMVERHRGPFPKRDLVAIWRQLITSTIAFEGPFGVAVYTGQDSPDTWELARDHFGAHKTMTRHGSVRSVIESVHRHDSAVGVLPMPRVDDTDPWWRHLVNSHADAPKIIAFLPFAQPVNWRPGGAEALVISPVAITPVGRDRIYVALESDTRAGLNQLAEAFANAGMPTTFTTVWRDSDGPGGWLYLAEVDGYVAQDDPRLEQLRRTAGIPISQLVWLGGYATPLSADELETAERPHAAAGTGQLAS